MIRRALRIFPALWVVVLLSLVVLGPVVSRLEWSQYWADPLSWQYLQSMFLNNQKALPGVFDSNPFPHAVNGSLWSLAVEFQAYLLLGLVGWGLRSRPVWGASVLLLVTASLLSSYFYLKSHTKPHFEVLFLFGMGAVWGQWLSVARKQSSYWHSAYWLLLPAACAALLYVEGGVARLGLLILTGMLVTIAAVSNRGHLLTVRWGDISYGVYIYAFPVQQTLAWWIPQASFALHLTLATVVTFVLAYASWHWIEKPFLRLKPFTPPAGHKGVPGGGL